VRKDDLNYEGGAHVWGSRLSAAIGCVHTRDQDSFRGRCAVRKDLNPAKEAPMGSRLSAAIGWHTSPRDQTASEWRCAVRKDDLNYLKEAPTDGFSTMQLGCVDTTRDQDLYFWRGDAWCIKTT
jgi:hypothetical protein